MPMLLRTDSGGPVGGSSGFLARLCGVQAPELRLPFAPGEVLPGSVVSLAELAYRSSLAVFFYGGVVSEGSGQSGSGGVEDARVEGWRELESEFAELGYGVVGISSQSSEEQVLFALDRMVSSFTFLSDRELLLADQLGLPTGSGPGGVRVYEPLTMLIRDGRTWWVSDPLARPTVDAEITIERIRKSRG